MHKYCMIAVACTVVVWWCSAIYIAAEDPGSSTSIRSPVKYRINIKKLNEASGFSLGHFVIAPCNSEQECDVADFAVTMLLIDCKLSDPHGMPD